MTQATVTSGEATAAATEKERICWRNLLCCKFNSYKQRTLGRGFRNWGSHVNCMKIRQATKITATTQQDNEEEIVFEEVVVPLIQFTFFIRFDSASLLHLLVRLTSTSMSNDSWLTSFLITTETKNFPAFVMFLLNSNWQSCEVLNWVHLAGGSREVPTLEQK